MNYFDHRLSKVLSDIRLEQVESIRKKKRNDKKGVKHRLGLVLIAQGERLAKREAKAV